MSEYATNNKVEQFEMPDDFLLRYHNLGERPLIGKKVAEFDYQVPAIDTTEISQMIENERSKRNNILYFNQYWKSSEISKQRINGEG